jgi:hypothetical protein
MQTPIDPPIKTNYKKKTSKANYIHRKLTRGKIK